MHTNDRFVRDYPEAASQLLKMYDKVDSTTSDLEETRQINKALCAEVARLQEAGSGAQSRDVEDLADALAREREANKRLSGEIVELRHALFDEHGDGGHVARPSSGEDGCACEARGELAALQTTFSEVDMRLEQQITAYNDMHERVVELEQEVKTKEQTSEARRLHIEDLECASQAKQTQCEGLQRRVDELQQQLVKAKSELHELKQASEAREEQLGQEKDRLQKENAKLREVYKEERYKHEKYKNLAMHLEQTLQEGSTRDSQLAISSTPAAPPPALLPAKSAESSHFEQTNLFASTAGQTAIHKAWRTTVEQMLRRPCFPLGDSSAPMHLPQQVQALLSDKVLSCPNRIVLSSSDRSARLISPVARCKGAAAPTELGEPMHELQRLINTRREVFYQSERGISYIGTYAGVAIGDVTAAEYAALPHAVKGGLLRQTFPCKQDFAATPAHEVERVSRMYASGAFRAQSLALRYVGFNQPLADALFALRAPERPRPPPVDCSSADSRAGPGSEGPVPAEMPPTPPADGEASFKLLQGRGGTASPATQGGGRGATAPGRASSVMPKGAVQAKGAGELCAAPVRNAAKRPAGAAPEGTRVEVKRVRVLVKRGE
ncbi:hypothetical protein PsYK624_104970 [Phanerochaete sordida]|uniref:Uncharacterized protein n=1 Tax=Phanerochaete sordida TaxID=48140 RepID=A0A9P3GG64_9APHY|nr:hypothetical protein PsYK624_104970 [Phanerochaete sordida]